MHLSKHNRLRRNSENAKTLRFRAGLGVGRTSENRACNEGFKAEHDNDDDGKVKDEEINTIVVRRKNRN